MTDITVENHNNMVIPRISSNSAEVEGPVLDQVHLRTGDSGTAYPHGN